jgi:hypothetical protein
LDEQREYTIAMPSYMANGCDGFDFIKSSKKIVDEGKGISIMNLLLKFFAALDLKHIPSHKKINSNKQISEKNIPSNRLHRIK